MPDTPYVESLTKVVCKAWDEAPPGMPDEVRQVLREQKGLSSEERASLLEGPAGKSRDQLRDALMRALVPAQDLESQNRLKAINTLSSLADNLGSLVPEGWKEQWKKHVLLLQSRCGRGREDKELSVQREAKDWKWKAGPQEWPQQRPLRRRKIYYPDQPGCGYLVYLKASLVGDEPEDVLEYRVKHPSFPHQSTADQWFTESQFESYRRQGLHIAKSAFRRDSKDELEKPEDRDSLFTRIWERWYPPSEALEKNFTRHAAAYDALVRELRSDRQLRWLDNDLFTPPGQVPRPLTTRLTGIAKRSFCS